MIKRIKAALAGAACLLLSFHASAATITYDFYKLTDNATEDLSSQLSMTVWDSTAANSQFSTSLNAGQVLFTVQNNVGIASNIAEVYFDDGLLGPSVALNSLGGYTDFTGGGANPSNLPGGDGAVPPFESSVTFSADVNPGPPGNGVNTSLDILGIVLGLGSLVDFDGVAAAVSAGTLRFGLHVRSIGVSGGSASYINNPPPTIDPPEVSVPGTSLLLGIGLLGLAWPGVWRQRLPQDQLNPSMILC
jgi:hypothetical protein